MRLLSLSFAVFASLAYVSTGAADGEVPKPLVVHEWGTFTVLQDDQGNPVDGVNINEESLPPFVYKLAPRLSPDSHALAPLLGLGHFEPRRSKGIERNYFAARMRMETPIVYLYPPEDQEPRPIDVSVKFNGGWVTEWYPQAQVSSPGYKATPAGVRMHLQSTTQGSIAWKGVQTSRDKAPLNTDSPVWLAPRETAAPILKSKGGEAEHYLFYRGVANLEAPLRVVRNGGELAIWKNLKSTCPIQDFDGLAIWLVDVREKGGLKFRRVKIAAASSDKSTKPSPKPIATTSATLESAATGLPALRKEMLAELIASGLFRDEAEAMLNTWEASYFKTPGMRVFFTLPQEWTDRVLPLSVKGYERTEAVRAMIGRIELISPRQRELIERIASGPISNRQWYYDWVEKNRVHFQPRYKDIRQGKVPLEELNLKPPADYQAYIELGRFRDALIKHASSDPKKRKSLQKFARNYGIR